MILQVPITIPDPDPTWHPAFTLKTGQGKKDVRLFVMETLQFNGKQARATHRMDIFKIARNLS
jgi:hypothetical protein